MPADKFARQCHLMTDQELVAALSVDRREYTAEFHMAVQAELSRRGVRLSEFKDRVVIRISDEGEKAGTIEQALVAFGSELNAFDHLSFTNCVGETLIFQPGVDSWIGHYADRGGYEFSFITRSSQEPGDVLKTFLKLEDWSAKIEETFDISEWDILMESDSADHIMSRSQILTQRRVPAVITNTRLFCLSAIRQDYCHGMPFKIMVPQGSLGEAQNVLQEIKNKIDELYLEAQGRAEQGDRQAELEALNRLAMLVFNDPRVHYRRGALLLELDKQEEAADAFIASLIINRGHEELFRAAYEGLEELSRKLPENVHILHNLATFSLARGHDPGSVETFYRKILSLKPEDAMAHLHIGYLYYERGDDISAYRHLKRYLELEPESQEREAIEQILGQLRSITTAREDPTVDRTAR